jgi:hypothetical protein
MLHAPKSTTVVLLALGAGLCVRSYGAATDGDLVTVVSSKVEGNYVRPKLPDGSFKPEYYAYAEGGRWTGSVRDLSIDSLPFMDVARTIAAPLQSQNYLPTRDPKATKLLIVLYWGRTRTPEHAGDTPVAQSLQSAAANVAAKKSQNQHQFYDDSTSLSSGAGMPCMRYSATPAQDTAGADNALSGALASAAAAEHTRDQINAENASLLGYDSWWDATSGYMAGTPLEHRRQDMIDELEHDRYFVVLMAYDFQAMWKQKKHVVLWETRFSVRQRGVEFDQQLRAMAQNASPFFGQDSGGLIRKALPPGHVDIGAVKAIGVVAEK